MKAIGVFHAERRCGVIDHPEPEAAGVQQAKLRVLEVGVCGTDKEITSFEYGAPPEGSPYLILGHESLAEVVECGPGAHLKPGQLVVATVRRPCTIASCTACRGGRQDFCVTGQYSERGIMHRHGFMAEYVIEDEVRLHPLPGGLRRVGVLTEPLTIAEKAISQLWHVQQRLPWMPPPDSQAPLGSGQRALVLGAGPVGLLGAMKLVTEGFDTWVYSLSPPGTDLAAVVEGFGARFVPAETVPVADVAGQTGNIDVIYEATGSSSLAYSVMPHLGPNGVFIFTGVPGLHGPRPTDIDALMRSQVLRNQVVLGTVNASPQNFNDAIEDLGEFQNRWPGTLASLISSRVPIEDTVALLSGHPGGIKHVISVAG